MTIIIQSPTKPFNLLQLPNELRHEILGYLLPSSRNPRYVKITKARGRSAIDRMFFPQKERGVKTLLALYSTCRTIYNELPTLRMLPESGALLPTIGIHLGPFPELLGDSEFEASLQRALVPASKLCFDLEEEDWT